MTFLEKMYIFCIFKLHTFFNSDRNHQIFDDNHRTENRQFKAGQDTALQSFHSRAGAWERDAGNEFSITNFH